MRGDRKPSGHIISFWQSMEQCTRQPVQKTIVHSILLILFYCSHIEKYIPCVQMSLPNATHSLDQMLNNFINMTERVTEIEAQFNFMCNADIPSTGFLILIHSYMSTHLMFNVFIKKERIKCICNYYSLQNTNTLRYRQKWNYISFHLYLFLMAYYVRDRI